MPEIPPPFKQQNLPDLINLPGSPVTERPLPVPGSSNCCCIGVLLQIPVLGVQLQHDVEIWSNGDGQKGTGTTAIPLLHRFVMIFDQEV